MNEQLQRAEEALRQLLATRKQGVTLAEVLQTLGDYGEAELRAAAWILKARGDADFADGKLKALRAIKLREHAAAA